MVGSWLTYDLFQTSANDEYRLADALIPAVAGNPTLPSQNEAFDTSIPLSAQNYETMKMLADRSGYRGMTDSLHPDDWDSSQWAVGRSQVGLLTDYMVVSVDAKDEFDWLAQHYDAIMREGQFVRRHLSRGRMADTGANFSDRRWSCSSAGSTNGFASCSDLLEQNQLSSGYGANAEAGPSSGSHQGKCAWGLALDHFPVRFASVLNFYSQSCSLCRTDRY